MQRKKRSKSSQSTATVLLFHTCQSTHGSSRILLLLSQSIVTTTTDQTSYFSKKSAGFSPDIDRHQKTSMASLWAGWTSSSSSVTDDGGVDFWNSPERAGWLMKQGEYLKTWRRRWFVLKKGKLFWFKSDYVARDSRPRGIIPVGSCLTVKGAEDALNKPFAFELSTNAETMYFIADSDKEKEEWINSIGRSIVQHSRSVTEREIVDYDNDSQPRRD
eukprot:TRINITY_DN16494_c0_g1_i1.p1 TRINITY_DN16494_c0_g1~~TRINITY_DN16494_c0_g1_i1.p1  ORF type:complete len:217 (+),score=24.96 TRINITY_DN16494_c0_g1_i1:93-743(+)